MEFFNDLIKEKYFYENAFPVENVCMPSWNVDEYMENEIDRLKKELRNTDIVSRKALIEEITGDLLKEIIGLYQCGINNRNTFPDNGAAAKQWEKYQYPNNLYLHEALGHVINIASDYEIEYSEEFINKWRTLRTRFSDVDMCLPDKYKESPADSNNRHAVLENEQERKPAQTADENLRKMRNDQFVNGYNNLVNYINEMDPIPINEKHQYLDNLMIAISEQLNRFSTCKTDYLKYIKTRLNNKEQFNIWASGSPILDNSKIPNVFDRIDGLIYEIEKVSKIDQNRNGQGKSQTFLNEHIVYKDVKQRELAEDIKISSLSNLKSKNIETENINKYYWQTFINRGKKKSVFGLYPVNDVFVFNRIARVYIVTYDKGLFDDKINLEKAINGYCNGFKNGYKEFTDQVYKDLRYNESTIVGIATLFFSPVGWYPHADNMKGKIIPKDWDVLGDRIGRFYAAWCIVLTHQNNFEPLFKELYNQQSPKQLPKELDTDEAKELRLFLIEKEFISKDTTENSFLYWFGCDIKYSQEIEPIKWKKTKQLARELLNGLYKKEDMPFADIEKIVPTCFVKNNQPMHLAKNKPVLSLDKDALTTFLATRAKS